MRVIYDQWGGFEFVADDENDGRDNLWLETMLKNIPEPDRKILSKYFYIDMVDMCHHEDGTPMKDALLEEAYDEDGDVWGTIERVKFNVFGE